jgi:hypothetical protein
VQFIDGEVSDILSLLAHAGAAPRNASSRAGRSAKLYLGEIRVPFSGGAVSGISASACACTGLLDAS